MSSNLRGSHATDPSHSSQAGLAPDELQAEQAGDLPERDAMSVIGVGGLEVGLPPPDILDDVIGVDPPVHTLPVDGLPVELYPVEPGPIEHLPIDPPTAGLPTETPQDGTAVGSPDLSGPVAGASVEV